MILEDLSVGLGNSKYCESCHMAMTTIVTRDLKPSCYNIMSSHYQKSDRIAEHSPVEMFRALWPANCECCDTSWSCSVLSASSLSSTCSSVCSTTPQCPSILIEGFAQVFAWTMIVSSSRRSTMHARHSSQNSEMDTIVPDCA